MIITIRNGKEKEEKIGVQPGRTKKSEEDRERDTQTEKRFRSYDKAFNAIEKRIGKDWY